MIRLLIIADDFTGALDTGVQLAGAGAGVKVAVASPSGLEKPGDSTEVLVVDAETRHLPSRTAYSIVRRIVEQALEMEVPHIYKKTDSALRGNIGAELSALLEASGERQLPFLPAFPQMGRVTGNGIHYIDGIPVSESVFGADPFEPVAHSSVADLIGEQSRVPVHVARPGERVDSAGIVVYDAGTVEDLQRTGEALAGTGKLHILAGCAGFGAVLPKLLGVGSGSPPVRPALDKRLLVICGSVNPITIGQLDEAEQNDFIRFRLTPRQKLEKGYWQTEAGIRSLQALREALARNPKMIIDSNDADGNQSTAVYAEERGLALEDVRSGVSRSIGYIVGGLFDSPGLGTLLITGGDTLLQCMETMGVREMEPICEMAPGVVLSRFACNSLSRYVISKSGGFGGRNLLEEIYWKINNP